MKHGRISAVVYSSSSDVVREGRSAAASQHSTFHDPERGADFDDDGRAIVVPRRSSY